MRMVMRSFNLLVCTLWLSACGFHLRGQESIPFDTVYLQTANPNTPFVRELRHSLEAKQIKMSDSAEQADLVLDIVSESPDKQVLSLGGDGRVNEFRLFYRVSLRAYDHQKDWIPPEEIVLRRDYSYDDSIVFAKEAEEALLYQSMRSDMVQQIMRRLSRAKLQVY